MNRSNVPGLQSTFFALIALGLVTQVYAQPVPATAYANRLKITTLTNKTNGGNVFSYDPTQMQWGPDGRLYVMTNSHGVHSYAYNATTGTLSDHKVANANNSGIGIAFQTTATKSYMYLTVDDHSNGAHGDTFSIHKLSDDNGNGVWGETGEKDVRIVTGIPVGDHAVDQLQIVGNTLYVGIGPRTINGRSGNLTSGSNDDFGGTGFWSGGNGNTWGDEALGGTICWIQDLTTVDDTKEGGANSYASTTITQNFIQNDDSPYTVTAKNKLTIHSAGTRNPFGFALDKNNQLYFTENFNRAKTNGDGTAPFGYPKDSFDTDSTFNLDIHDQLFKAEKGADYGYSATNWRGKGFMLSADGKGANRRYSLTFDNLFTDPNSNPPIYDPDNPVGLGPSSSSDGCAFNYAHGLPKELAGQLFIAHYNTSIQEGAGAKRTIQYGDVVSVNLSNIDPTHAPTLATTAPVRRIAKGFHSATAMLWDKSQRLLVADIDTGTGNGGAIYALQMAVRADFAGDGNTDLVWQNTKTGQVGLWYMTGATYRTGQVLANNPGPGWKLVGTPDLNGDGKPDLLWQNSSAGQVAYWLMNGSTVISGALLKSGVPASQQVIGTADFNGDDNPDVLVQDSQTGAVSVWFLNGTNFVSAATIATSVTLDWKVVGIADLDGNGKPDLVFQNIGTGDIAYWLLNGATYVSNGTITKGVPLQWQIIGTPDLDGDGNSDLLWRNTQTGDVTYWLMNGATYVSGAYLSSGLSLDWQCTGLR